MNENVIALSIRGWGVVIADPKDNTITMANPALAEMYCYDESETIGLRSIN